MTNRTNIDATAITQKTVDRISIKQRRGVWSVALNGKFYGDYVRRNWALEAAFEKADDIIASGGAAIVTEAMHDQQDAVLYDTRLHAPREKTAPGANARMEHEWRWPDLVGASFAKRLLAQTRP